MPRFTTIVSVVSLRSDELVSAVEVEAANVSAVLLSDIEGRDDSERRRGAWGEAMRRRNVYTLIDFDPLASLIDAWVDRLQGRTHALDAAPALGEGEGLAEYVLVADDVTGDVVHWYHGLLRGFAPRRVVAVQPHPASIVDALAHLKPGPAFPDAGAIARAALDYVPTGMSTEVAPPPKLVLDR